MKIHQYTATAAMLLSLITADAGQAIYKSIGKETVIGNGKIIKLSTKGFLVLDPDTLVATSIGAFTLNGQKLFSIVPLQNYNFVEVDGGGGSVYQVAAKAESPGTQFANTLLTSDFSIGKATLVTIDSTGPRIMARRVTTTGQSIAQNALTGVTAAGTSTGTAVLDVKASLASNNFGESFDAAVNRLAATFVAAGYTQYTPAPAP